MRYDTFELVFSERPSKNQPKRQVDYRRSGVGGLSERLLTMSSFTIRPHTSRSPTEKVYAILWATEPNGAFSLQFEINSACDDVINILRGEIQGRYLFMTI